MLNNESISCRRRIRVRVSSLTHVSARFFTGAGVLVMGDLLLLLLFSSLLVVVVGSVGVMSI